MVDYSKWKDFADSDEEDAPTRAAKMDTMLKKMHKEDPKREAARHSPSLGSVVTRRGSLDARRQLDEVERSLQAMRVQL